MGKINKIKEFVKEHENYWAADWEADLQLKYCIFFSHYYNNWNYEFMSNMEFPEVTYMSENCAKLLVDKLNSGEITL
jgi:hypothetical protein